MFQKIILPVSTVFLAVMFLVVFFGGTWDGVRIGLEILGAVYLLQMTYSVVHDEQKKKDEEKERNIIRDRYFRD